jgi:hypothetical protein
LRVDRGPKSIALVKIREVTLNLKANEVIQVSQVLLREPCPVARPRRLDHDGALVLQMHIVEAACQQGDRLGRGGKFREVDLVGVVEIDADRGPRNSMPSNPQSAAFRLVPADVGDGLPFRGGGALPPVRASARRRPDRGWGRRCAGG